MKPADQPGEDCTDEELQRLCREAYANRKNYDPNRLSEAEKERMVDIIVQAFSPDMLLRLVVDACPRDALIIESFKYFGHQ